MIVWLRYAGLALLVTGVVTAAGWPFLHEEGRRGLLLAGALALPVQLAAFGGMAACPSGSAGFLATRVGASLLRLAVVGAAAIAVARVDGVDTLTALLALAGLLFVLLLLEPWALRKRQDETDRTGRSGNES